MESRTGRIVHDSASDRAALHRFLFRADWDDPALYDVVVNTHTITPEQGADLIRQSVLSGQSSKKQPAGASRLEQLYLAEKVDNHISFVPTFAEHFAGVRIGTERREGWCAQSTGSYYLRQFLRYDLRSGILDAPG